MRNYLKFNSLIAFEDIDTQKWEFSVQYETLITKGTTNADEVAFSCQRNSCYFMTRE